MTQIVINIFEVIIFILIYIFNSRNSEVFKVFYLYFW